MPLRPMMGARAYAKWGIDFVKPIDPPTACTHAIAATDYMTKWVEATATPKNDAHTTAKFLYENVFTRYGLPIEIMRDRGLHFLNEAIEHILKWWFIGSQLPIIHTPMAKPKVPTRYLKWF